MNYNKHDWKFLSNYLFVPLVIRGEIGCARTLGFLRDIRDLRCLYSKNNDLGAGRTTTADPIGLVKLLALIS